MSQVRNYSVISDIKHTWFVCLVLLIGMLPLWADGYCMYILAILLPILILKVRNYDGMCGLIILYSLAYTLSLYNNGNEFSPSTLIFDLFFPFIMYQSGRYIINRQRNPVSSVLLLVSMAISLALPAIIENIKDTIESGELINLSRWILDNTGEKTRTATGYGMMVSIMNGCLGLILVRANNNIDSKLKILLIVFSILAIFSTIHLLNRTGLVLALISIITVSVIPPYSLRRNIYLIISFIIILAVGAIFFSDSPFLTEAIQLYEERDEGEGSVSSYGGRSERWEAGIDQLLSEPFGNYNGLYFRGLYTYAHNMWLDAGVFGGQISFVLLIIITIISLKKILILYRSKILSSFENTVIMLIYIAIIAQCAVEPVIQGVPQLFFYYIFFISIIINLYNKYHYRHYMRHFSKI